MNDEVERIFSEHSYIDSVRIFRPLSDSNPGAYWLAAGLSGGTPKRGMGRTPAEAITDLRISLEVV